MDKKNETEEERQDRYRKEVLDEINDLNMHSKLGKSVESYGIKNKKSYVNFSKDKIVKEEKKEIDSSSESKNAKISVGNYVFYFICLAIIVGGIFAFPLFDDLFTKIKLSFQKEEKVIIEKEPEKVYEKITLQSPVLQKLVYPELHPEHTKVSSYYKNNNITVAKMNNLDILYNAFLDIYDGAILPYNGEYVGQYCVNSQSKVYFNANYINLRIENIFNKKTKYEYADFYVPKGSSSKYVGLWKYDSKEDIYVYYGDCKNEEYKYLYYDINIPYDVNASEKNIDLDVYSYLGFVKIDSATKKYTIYRNADYTEELSKGVLKTNNYKNELINSLDKLNRNNLKKYKYSFSMLNCAYEDYCFVSGEWVE